MNERPDPLDERLRRALPTEVSPATRNRHLAVLERELAPSPPTGWRRRVTALGAAAALTVPTGVAVAAESAVPGDLLYPVKRVTETLRRLVDADVAAEHRVEELEQLLRDRGTRARLAEAVGDASAAVSQLEPTDPLRTRYRVAADEAMARLDRDRTTDEGVDDVTPTRPTRTTEPAPSRPTEDPQRPTDAEPTRDEPTSGTRTTDDVRPSPSPSPSRTSDATRSPTPSPTRADSAEVETSPARVVESDTGDRSTDRTVEETSEETSEVTDDGNRLDTRDGR